MTSGFALFLALAAFYGFVALFGKQAPRAFLFFAWAFLALWTIGTVVYGAYRLLLAG